MRAVVHIAPPSLPTVLPLVFGVLCLLVYQFCQPVEHVAEPLNLGAARLISSADCLEPVGEAGQPVAQVIDL